MQVLNNLIRVTVT